MKYKLIENYDVIRGVELVGTPIPLKFDRTPKYPGADRQRNLHPLERLKDPEFYGRKVLPEAVEVTMRFSRPTDLYGNCGRIALSPVSIDVAEPCLYFLENSNIAKILEPLGVSADKPNYFPGRVIYEQALQPLGQNNGNGLVSFRRGGRPMPALNLSGTDYKDLEGLASVKIFSKEVDYLARPDIHEEIFNEEFRADVRRKAEEIGDLKRMKVKAAILSPIQSSNDYGKVLLLGVSYLV